MSDQNSEPKSRVETANERRRKKSEISLILQDLDRLQSIPPERKKRWIWELLQNARDEAPVGGSEVVVRLTENELLFIHNGKAFDIDSLLAIITRTSTKPFSENDDEDRYYGNVDQAIPWQTDQSKNWRNGAANAVEALLQS